MVAGEEGIVVSQLQPIPNLQPSRYSIRLNADEISGLASLFRKAIDLFHGDDESAMRWLKSPRPALGGETPLELAKTDIGARQVETLIEQVRHGVFV